MKLKEFISYTFANGRLDVYDHGNHIVSQPFNSDTGDQFRDVDQALGWLAKYYPHLYVVA